MTKEYMTFEIYKELVGMQAFDTCVNRTKESLLEAAEAYVDAFEIWKKQRGETK